MSISKEMQRALEADGKKLRQLTGEDHGPRFDEYATCPVCNGDGTVEEYRPQHDDPEFAVIHQCLECNGSGYVLAGDDGQPHP